MADHSEPLHRSWHLLRQAEALAPHPNPTFGNPAWDDATFRVAVVRLSPLEDVGSSSTHLFLAQAVRIALPEAFVDLAFLPSRQDRRVLRSAGITGVFGTQSWRSLEDFDLVLLSCAYVLECLNVPSVLSDSGIPPSARERGADDPLVLLGGSSAMAAHSLVRADGDGWVDGIHFGDGEDATSELVRAAFEHREEDRATRLAELARRVPGFWPIGSPQVEVENAIFAGSRAAESGVPYPIVTGEAAATARLSVSRGCKFGCAFCFEGATRKPYREPSLPEIVESTLELKRRSGATRVELAAYDFGSHSALGEVLFETHRLFRRVAAMSQRADVLAAVPGRLDVELAAGKRSFTIGVEGISARLRAFLQRPLAEEPLRGLLQRLIEKKVREVKAFYVLTAYEEEADFAELRAFTEWLEGVLSEERSGTRIVLSFNRLVRMPFTPLQYDRLCLDRERWDSIAARIEELCLESGIEFRLATGWPEYAIEQLLALGGSESSELLAHLAEQGFVFDGDLPEEAWGATRRWAEARGLLEGGFVEPKPEQHVFPFSFVATRLDRAALYDRYRRALSALREERSPGIAAEPRTDAAPGRDHPPTEARRIHDLVAAKARLAPVFCRVVLPERIAGASNEWIETWLMRELLSLHPRLAEDLLSVTEAVFGSDGGPPGASLSWHGEGVFELVAWSGERIRSRLEALVRELRGFHVLDWPAACAPGVWHEWQVSVSLPRQLFPNAVEKLQEHLEARHSPITWRRAGSALELEPSPRATKKRAILGGSCRTTKKECVMDLAIGPRFDLAHFLASFSGPATARRALVHSRRIRL